MALPLIQRMSIARRCCRSALSVSRAGIGPLGAVVATSDGLLTLEVPAAALRSPVTVRIAPATAPPWTEGFVSHVYDFSPDVDFAIPGPPHAGLPERGRAGRGTG